jgi:hypothetical protein
VANSGPAGFTMALEEFLIDTERKIVIKVSYKRAKIA